MKKPDLFADPKGFEKWLDAEIKKHKGRHARAELVNRSFDKLKRRNPKEFCKAYNALISLNSKNRQHCKLVQKIYDADNPAKSLLQWWRGEDK